MLRERLPNRREKNSTTKVRIGNQTLYLCVGHYPDGRPGEVFIDVNKAGTAVRAWADATAKLISLMLQYGVPLSEITDALDGANSVPFGAVQVSGHPQVTQCTGEIDFVAKALANDYPEANKAPAHNAWDLLADAMDRLFGGGECDADEVVEKLTDLGADDALETFLEAFEGED